VQVKNFNLSGRQVKMQFSSHSCLKIILQQSIKCSLQMEAYLHHIHYVNKQNMWFGAYKNPHIAGEMLPIKHRWRFSVDLVREAVIGPVFPEQTVNSAACLQSLRNEVMPGSEELWNRHFSGKVVRVLTLRSPYRTWSTVICAHFRNACGTVQRCWARPPYFPYFNPSHSVSLEGTRMAYTAPTFTLCLAMSRRAVTTQQMRSACWHLGHDCLSTRWNIF
jgi:hypothetical protein